MKTKKCDTIYCLIPRHARMNRYRKQSLYKSVAAWSTNYDDLCDYMNQHKTRNEFEILIGTKKKFKKESPDAYELTELIFIHNQLTIRGYANDLWEFVSKKRECYNNSIGVLSFLALDEGTDKNETKILKKAIAILEERRDMDCDPVDPKILQENHELNQQWKEHL